MSRFENREALAGKIGWEGGMESALDYGIKLKDLPEGDTELAVLWADMEDKWWVYREAAEKVEAILPDCE